MIAEDIAILERLAEGHPDPAVRRALTAALIELGIARPPVERSELERDLEEKHRSFVEWLAAREKVRSR